MSQTENLTLAEKCRNAEVALAADNGSFALFSLIQREVTAGKWDVVASAPWLTTNRAGIQLIVDGLLPFLTQADWLRIAGVVPVAIEAEFVQAMTRFYDTEHDVQATGPIYTNDVTVDRAVIITANKKMATPTEFQSFVASP